MNGLGRSACTQDEGFFVETLEHRFYALCKTNHIAIETFQQRFTTFMLHADNIHSTNGTCFGRYIIQKTDDGLLVRQRDIKPLQRGILRQDLG